MKYQPNIQLLDPRSIYIDRERRQREVFTIDDLVLSIPQRGQLQPIIVRPFTEVEGFQFKLIAGERRLTTFLEHPEFGQVQATIRDTADAAELETVELEENIRRQDLAWTERVEAVLRIHEHQVAANPKWSLTNTADYLGEIYRTVHRQIMVAKAIREGNTKVADANGWDPAYTILEAQNSRKREHATAALNEDIAGSFQPLSSYAPGDVKTIQSAAATAISQGKTEILALPAAESPVPILNLDCIPWMNDYRGVPFNFFHCDFPYGINYDEMDQANLEKQGSYEDSPEVYFSILDAFCKNLNRLISVEAHGIFWFSTKMWDETHDFFRKNAPDLWIQDVPLVWLKSDNRGILADPRRRPRNITEFALLITRGDRKIVKPVSNAYSAPTSKTIHGSEKPVPVLKHFFSMLVDENTRMIDPTSGSANSLIAALDFRPASMLGLEKDSTFHSRSVEAFRKVLKLKQLSEKVNG